MSRIYFDNAATTPLSATVLQEMMPFLTENFGNPSSIHADGRKARTAIEQARKTVATYLNASVGELFFTSSGSESNNMVIKRAATDLGVSRLITTKIEHHCVLHSAETAAREQALTLIYLSVDAHGRISLHELEQHLQQAEAEGEKVLISLMHLNNEIGTAHDLVKISALSRQYNAYFHCDAVQSFGKYPIDMQQTPLDFLTASAHKFHGPKGVGLLYINSDLTLKPFIDGGAQERNMRGGTENVPGIVGFAAALHEATTQMAARKSHITALKQYFIEQLKSTFSDIEFNGDVANENSAYHIVSLSFAPSMRADMLIFNLDIAGISASGGSACSSGVENASHVLAETNPDSTRRTDRKSVV